MTFLFILCPAAIVLIAFTNLVNVGSGGGDVKERMERRGSDKKGSAAPMAPKVKFDPTATTHGGEVSWTEDDARTEEHALPAAA